jgi:hypothetical protein
MTSFSAMMIDDAFVTRMPSKVGVLDGEPSNHDFAQCRMVEPIDVDAIREVNRIDHAATATTPHQRERLPDRYVLVVPTRRDLGTGDGARPLRWRMRGTDDVNADDRHRLRSAQNIDQKIAQDNFQIQTILA